MSSLTISQASQFDNFGDFLAKNLRVDTKLRVYHVSTGPVSASPVFAAPRGTPEEPTTCESHFLAVSLQHVTSSSDGQKTSDDQRESSAFSKKDHVLVLGIEVLIFSTKSLTTIFVSKADSTGLLPRLKNTDQESLSIIKAVISAFLEWLVSLELTNKVPDLDGVTKKTNNPPSEANNEDNACQRRNSALTIDVSRPNRKKIVLSLFARSQNQYLFPGSIENETKHVLDDRQLIKWWCRVLDTLMRKTCLGKTPTSDHNTEPSLAVSSDASASQDKQHDPNTSIAITTNAYVIVPGCDLSETIRSFYPPSAKSTSANATSTWHNSFPIDFLVGEDASVIEKTLPVRCMIPRFPDDPKARYCGDLDDSGVDDQGQWRNMRSLKQFWETMEYRQECSAGRAVGFIWVTFDAYNPTLQSNEKNRLTSTQESAGGYVESTDVRLPPTSVSLTPIPSDATILTSEQYIELSDLLINNTDFAGVSAAVKSTNEWVSKVKELSGKASFGVDVEGRIPIPNISQNSHGPISSSGNDKASITETAPAVNILTAVRRKKRKAEEGGPSSNDDTSEKLAKSENAGPQEAAATPPQTAGTETVQTLSAGLVRKKPKVKQ